ncbi:hypothetical protein Hanom_Chr12g01132311 [Helianthus anomalus]
MHFVFSIIIVAAHIFSTITCLSVFSPAQNTSQKIRYPCSWTSHLIVFLGFCEELYLSLLLESKVN